MCDRTYRKINVKDIDAYLLQAQITAGSGKCSGMYFLVFCICLVGRETYMEENSPCCKAQI